MYRILPSKRLSLCKRPPPFFHDPMVCVYMRYTYKWLLRVNAHPLFLAREFQASIGTYSEDYGTSDAKLQCTYYRYNCVRYFFADSSDDEWIDIAQSSDFEGEAINDIHGQRVSVESDGEEAEGYETDSEDNDIHDDDGGSGDEWVECGSGELGMESSDDGDSGQCKSENELASKSSFSDGKVTTPSLTGSQVGLITNVLIAIV